MFDSHRNRALLKSNWILFKLKLISSKLNWTLYEQKSKLSIQKLNVTFLHLKSQKVHRVFEFLQILVALSIKMVLSLFWSAEQRNIWAHCVKRSRHSLIQQVQQVFLFILNYFCYTLDYCETLRKQKAWYQWNEDRDALEECSTAPSLLVAKQKIRAPLNFKKDSSASVGKRIKILRKFQHCIHCFFAGQLIVKFQ